MSPPAGPSAPASAPPCLSAAEHTQWFKDEVHPHGGQLKSWLRGNYPSVRDVDDVVQESYLRIWKARAAQPIASAKAFLFRIARNLALDDVRRATHSPLEGQSSLAGLDVLDTAPDAARACSAKEAIEHLSDAIAALPERARQVIVLHKIKGMSQKEVARALGLSERTVENYTFNALNRCEAHLRRKGINGFFG